LSFRTFLMESWELWPRTKVTFNFERNFIRISFLSLLLLLVSFYKRQEFTG
jgi:hypothetical protein